MRAMRAETFSGYGGLQLVDLPKPNVANERVLVRVTAAGVTPLDHTILSGGHPRPKPPLVLGGEGAGIVEEPGASGFPAGARVMFAGPYGFMEAGAWQEWLAVRPEDLCLVPDNIDDVTAAGLPVAYLTAALSLRQAGFRPGMSVLAPAIGGSVGNAVTQLATALGAAKAISTSTSAAKVRRARHLGFTDVIDLSVENVVDGMRRVTGDKGADVVIDSVGGNLTGQMLGTLAMNGAFITLGYSAGRATTINVTDLIWKRARMEGFALAVQSADAVSAAWASILPALVDGRIKPLVARSFALKEAPEALRYLIEDRPFGRVVLTL